MAIGDHVYVERLGGVYSHHGIDCGDGWVIHYNGPDPFRTRVRRATLSGFAAGNPLQIRRYDTAPASESPAAWLVGQASLGLHSILDQLSGRQLPQLDTSPEAVVARAESRLGERGFDFVFNNCEHFATWCKTGSSASRQIESLVKQLVPLEWPRLASAR